VGVQQIMGPIGKIGLQGRRTNNTRSPAAGHFGDSGVKGVERAMAGR
jgi:hypothetical protein